MKKGSGILAFLTIFLSSLVSAGPVEGVEQLVEGLREVISIVVQFLSNVLFDLESFDEFFFAKLLILLIIFFAVYTVLKKNKIFGSDQKIAIIIASAISILSVRYLPSNFVQAILLQYSVFAVAITILLPFLIFFFFLHQSEIKRFGRRAGWVIYAVSFLAMWSFRYNEIGDANYIYWIGITFVILSFIFDTNIHKYFKLSDFKRTHSRIKQEARYKLEERAEKAAERLEKKYMTPEQYKEEIKLITKAIKEL